MVEVQACIFRLSRPLEACPAPRFKFAGRCIGSPTSWFVSGARGRAGVAMRRSGRRSAVNCAHLPRITRRCLRRQLCQYRKHYHWRVRGCALRACSALVTAAGLWMMVRGSPAVRIHLVRRLWPFAALPQSSACFWCAFRHMYGGARLVNCKRPAEDSGGTGI